ncbi:unnamed protein product [Closterium sp. NIES-65]|nr:unnamed protein product [Closterium sp. NIES-65]
MSRHYPRPLIPPPPPLSRALPRSLFSSPVAPKLREVDKLRADESHVDVKLKCILPLSTPPNPFVSSPSLPPPPSSCAQAAQGGQMARARVAFAPKLRKVDKWRARESHADAILKRSSLVPPLVPEPSPARVKSSVKPSEKLADKPSDKPANASADKPADSAGVALAPAERGGGGGGGAEESGDGGGGEIVAAASGEGAMAIVQSAGTSSGGKEIVAADSGVAGGKRRAKKARKNSQKPLFDLWADEGEREGCDDGELGGGRKEGEGDNGMVVVGLGEEGRGGGLWGGGGGVRGGRGGGLWGGGGGVRGGRGGGLWGGGGGVRGGRVGGLWGGGGGVRGGRGGVLWGGGGGVRGGRGGGLWGGGGGVRGGRGGGLWGGGGGVRGGMGGGFGKAVIGGFTRRNLAGNRRGVRATDKATPGGGGEVEERVRRRGDGKMIGGKEERNKPGSAIPAVEIDAPGCSFNPSIEEHQDAIAVAVAEELKESYQAALAPTPPQLMVSRAEEEEARMQEAAVRMGGVECGGFDCGGVSARPHTVAADGVTSRGGGSTDAGGSGEFKEVECGGVRYSAMGVGIDFFLTQGEEDEEEEEEEEEDEDGNTAAVTKHRVPKRLTRADLNRRMRHKLVEAELAKRRKLKAMRKDLDRLKDLQRELEEEREEAEKRRVRREIARVELRMKRAPRLGRHKFKPEPMSVLTSDQVTGSLRQLKQAVPNEEEEGGGAGQSGSKGAGDAR